MRSATLLLLLAVAAAGEDVAFVGVNVVPMDGPGVLTDRTVLVRDGRIAAVGPAPTFDVPAGAARIDGKGRWLLPGLADMHVHNWYEEEHVLFLANGVTTVRNLWGAPMHLRWAREIAAGDRLGPTLVTAGPILDGAPPVWEESDVVTTPEEARRAVRRHADAGYAEIKVYNRLKPEVYEAAVAEAHARGLRVAGHVPWGLPLARALELGQDSIEHLEGYLGMPWRWNEAEFTALAEATARRGAWNCPTLVVYVKFVGGEEAGALAAAPEMRFVPPRLRATWDPERDFRLKDMSPQQFEWMKKWNAIRRRGVAILHAKEAPLLLGTDAGNPFVIAGWAVHEELALLVQAGLDPYEALKTATANPARYLGSDGGTIAPGKRADLLLLAGNPLEDVAHAARPLGVMVRGRWLDRDELARRLEEVAASYARPKERFRGMADLPAGELHRYEISWNGLVVGEERFTHARGEDGSVTVHAQQVNDPPWSVRRTVRLTFDAAGAVATYGGDGGEERVELPDDALVLSPALASWTLAARRFADLAPGEARTFAYRERGGSSFPLRVRRVEGETGGGGPAYELRFERREGAYDGWIAFDAAGVPVERRDELQQGTVLYRRVR